MMDERAHPNPAAPMDSWAMACSLLVGTRQALAKAREEHTAILAANPGRTFVAAASVTSGTIGVLRDVESTLDWELSRIGRSASLPVPAKVKA